MRFQEFSQMAQMQGLKVSSLNNGFHWQITGGATDVNFYPTTGKIYIPATANGFHCSVNEALRIAKTGDIPTQFLNKAHRKQNYKRNRKKLLRQSPKCKYCGKDLTPKTATIDHHIPLDKGGSNGDDNLVLACEDCNKAKGNLMPQHFKKTVQIEGSCEK